MSEVPFDSVPHNIGKEFIPSDDVIGFEKAFWLLLLGGGCLLAVLIFGVILCRLDLSAGKKRRERLAHQVED